ncbi:hypothetical protein DLM46_32895 [Paraburkholderia lacunae]|uniref:Uncharacterized protein n=1 Tax=Paraburkholderia lacunae TaxID=2211104 RepID=A0A370MYS3_9BURK|nr:hypothetical protein DLM46_32895 [Paraburkholderia lacunae]
MSRYDVKHLALLLLIPAGCACVGLMLGRLIRGRRPRIERDRPRMAMSADFLRAAHDSRISMHTRMKCAFECIYFCLCEIAESRGLKLNGLVHPNVKVIQAGLSALDVSEAEQSAVEKLAQWTADASPFLPAPSVGDAFYLAARINARAVSVLTRLRS